MDTQSPNNNCAFAILCEKTAERNTRIRAVFDFSVDIDAVKSVSLYNWSEDLERSPF